MVLDLRLFSQRFLPAMLLILVVGIAVYANTFQVPFALDDYRTITGNAVIKNLENFSVNSTGYEFLPNRSVAMLSFAVNYFFGGLEVAGYHTVNLLIHLLSALLVFTLLQLTFHTPYFAAQGESDSGSGFGSTSTRFSLFFTPHVFIPLFATLLFVVHPVQTQAVTYVVQRMASLTTMFFLLSCVLYVLARLSIGQSGNRNQKAAVRTETIGSTGRVKQGLLLTGSVLAAVLAMKTKEIAFTLPMAVLLYEVFFFQGAWKRRLLYLLPLIATLPIIPMTILDFDGFNGDILSDTGKQMPVGNAIPWLDYFLTQFRVIVTYLRLLVLPVNQNLDYDYPVYTDFFAPQVFLSFLLLATIFALAVYLFWRTKLGRVVQVKNNSGSEVGTYSTSPLVSSQLVSHSLLPYLRLISFGIIWFFLTLSVESSLIPLEDVIMEHRLYLPAFGAAAVVATIFSLIALKFFQTAYAKLFIAVVVMMIVVLGFATLQRNHVWGDTIRLWQDVVAKSPNKARALNNLGVSLEDAGRRPEAITVLSRAIAVAPDYGMSYYNLADLYLVSDNPDKSLPLLHTAIRINPSFTRAYVSIGAALMRSGRFSDVITFLEENLDHVKGDAEAHFYLGASYAFQGNRAAALRELAIVSQGDPELAATLRGILR
jgi:hypothetical protein